jgi:hypothetical protein
MSRDRELARGNRHDDTPARPVRRANDPVLALQKAAGNRAVGQMLLARQPSASKQSSTVKIGKFTIDVAGGNLGAWAAAPKGDAPDKLVVTSEKGKHSGELARLAKDHTKITLLTLTVPSENKSGQLDLGSSVIEISGGVIKKYDVEGTTETWEVADYTGVKKTTTTHNIGQH